MKCFFIQAWLCDFNVFFNIYISWKRDELKKKTNVKFWALLDVIRLSNNYRALSSNYRDS